MAAVSIANSPHTISAMSGRRLPLQSNPNAANSPYRAITAVAAKQKRSYATIQREETYGQPPPAKKQMVKVNQSGSRSPTRQSLANAPEGRVFTRKSNVAQPSAFARKLEALRVKPGQQLQAPADNKAADENLDTIRQWQRHYRKVFPKFVFYFESVSEDSRIKFSKQVTALGAREEKFFSNAVTHVVTTRPIPREQDISSTETNNDSTNNDSQPLSGNLQTINPSLLDRSSEPSAAQFEARPSRSKYIFEAPVGRKVVSNPQDVDVRRQQGRNADVLHRARALGMKIWASEKLERMMITMFDTDTGANITHGHNTRSITTQNNAIIVPRSNREADLSQLLRNERINGPSDRDPTVAMKEMVIFKGPFIYIHDIDEKQKPIMVREYAKVSHKEDGDWPQFRSVSHGRCPFIEEIDDDRRDAQREMARQQKVRERDTSVAPTIRAVVGATTKMEPPKDPKDTRPLAQVKNGANRGTATAPTNQPALFEMVPPTMDIEHSSKGSQNIFVSRAGPGRMVGGEPVASGVQPSNITSAIRSQVISSTAAAPGAKAGTSKEVHGLQRKVLERNSGSATFGQTSSHRMTDFHTVVKEDLTGRATKQRNKGKLDLIAEDFSHVEAKDTRHAEPNSKAKPVEKKKAEKTHGKLGYCENCMETFADFNEHASSRKHRKFAENNDNWLELDALLRQLARPFREESY